MYQRSQISEGMVVRSNDGEKLGKVFAIGDDSFQIEKGLFFPKDYLVRYAEISDVRGGEIILTHGKESLRQLGEEDRYGTASLGTNPPGTVSTSSTATGRDTTGMPIGAPVSTAPSTGLGMGADTRGLRAPIATDDRSVSASASTSASRDLSPSSSSSTSASRDLGMSASSSSSTSASRDLGAERTLSGRSEDITVPVHKEELDVRKREAQAGEVRVKKDVVEEEKVMDVPVRRERVRVERREVTDRPAVNASFQEETVVVPLRAEEVDVQKRAMVDEEVVIHKDTEEEQRRVAETVRREEVSVRSDGDVEGPRKLNLSSDADDPSKKRT